LAKINWDLPFYASCPNECFPYGIKENVTDHFTVRSNQIDDMKDFRVMAPEWIQMEINITSTVIYPEEWTYHTSGVYYEAHTLMESTTHDTDEITNDAVFRRLKASVRYCDCG